MHQAFGGNMPLKYRDLYKYIFYKITDIVDNKRVSIKQLFDYMLSEF